MKLRFDNYRKPFDLSARPSDVERQVQDIVRGGKEEELGRLELVDVVDQDSGETLYQLYLWQPGSGRLYKNGTTERVGYVAQHGLEVDDLDLLDALQEAFEKSNVFEEDVFFD